MSEILQAISDVDCLRAFSRFASEHVLNFRRYHELCVDIGESKFMSGNVKFSVHVGPDGSSQELDHAGREPLDSMMMSFRQLWMKKEPTFFPALRNVLRGNAAAVATPEADEAVVQLDGIAKRFKTVMEKAAMSHAAPDESGWLKPYKDFSQEYVIEAWIYGGHFHSDRKKMEFVRSWCASTYEFTLSKAVHDACDSYWELDLLIQRILNEPDLVNETAPM